MPFDAVSVRRPPVHWHRQALLLGLGAVSAVAAAQATRLGFGGVVPDVVAALIFVVWQGAGIIMAGSPSLPIAAPLGTGHQPMWGDAPAGGQPTARDAMPVGAVARELRRYVDVAAILRRQAECVSTDTEEAAVAVLARLADLDNAIEGLLAPLAEAERVAADIRDAGGREVRQMHEAVRELRSLVGARTTKALAEQALYTEIAAEVAATLGAITGIAKQTQMLSFNATIEAAHAGKAGKGFKVIADEVRQLSNSASKAAVEARDGLTRLAATSDRCKQAEEEAEKESILLKRVERQAAAASDGFTRLAEQGRSMLVAAHSSGATVTVSMMDALGSIQFQDIVRQKLGHVGESLERLGLHAVGMADALQHSGNVMAVEDDLLEPMRAAYVMQSEHNAHDNGSTVGNAGLAIELF